MFCFCMFCFLFVFCSMLCHALCCAMLLHVTCYVILHHILLYCIDMYCTILYCTVLCCPESSEARDAQVLGQVRWCPHRIRCRPPKATKQLPSTMNPKRSVSHIYIHVYIYTYTHMYMYICIYKYHMSSTEEPYVDSKQALYQLQ